MPLNLCHVSSCFEIDLVVVKNALTFSLLKLIMYQERILNEVGSAVYLVNIWLLVGGHCLVGNL